VFLLHSGSLDLSHAWNRSGGAVADGTGPSAPAPPGSGMGQQGSMNNYPLRGGKGGYFEGGVRVASFVHSPLLPAAVVGSTLDVTISVADWWATFVSLSGLEPVDRGFVPDSRFALPAPWGCYEHGKCTFPPVYLHSAYVKKLRWRVLQHNIPTCTRADQLDLPARTACMCVPCLCARRIRSTCGLFSLA
jgi:hypothetical protein